MTEESMSEGFIAAEHVSFRRLEEEKVQVTLPSGEELAVGRIMRAFPLSNQTRFLVVHDEEGDEIGILDDISQLDSESQAVVYQEIEKSYFMPTIVDVLDISDDINVLSWQVRTDRGERIFQTRHIRRNIRKLGGNRIIIKDVDGNRYEIEDWRRLPPHSVDLLSQYL